LSLHDALPILAAAAAAGSLLLAGCSRTPVASPASTSAANVPASAAALQQQFVQVVKQIGPAVVLIQTSQGLGSGIVFTSTGDIVTNSHVVADASSFQVSLANGKQYPGRLVGSFAPDDL